MNKLPISVLIPTRNAENTISACINSVAFADQIIIIDSSEDNSTRLIAETKGAEIFYFVWNGKFPKKKQWALENVEFRNEWIMMLDADEIISDEFKRELEIFLELESSKYLDFSAMKAESTFYFGRKLLKHGHRTSKVMLLRRGKCEYSDISDLFEGNDFDMELHYQPKVNGRIGKLRSRIIHGERMDVTEWLIKHVKYADSEALGMRLPNARKQMIELKNPGAKLFHKIPFKPVVFFIYSYFLRFGFLDGRAGFYYARSMAHYFWLSKMIFNTKYQYENVNRKDA